MKKAALLLALFANTLFVIANSISVKVPETIEFADIKLKLTSGAQKIIQKEVDALTRSETYYNIKADRIRLYFPIIEKTLKEEGVPTDFKYLAVQESALISDAVSSANAVGFWQFKDFTGREVGLRIDRRVDERLNIVSSTIGAAKYFKRHNFFFDNWVYTLLAHMTGRGGAAKYVDEGKFGTKKMVIDRNTHWYVIRFLSHKIAFEEADKGHHSEGLKLVTYEKGGGQTLREIAKKTKTDETELSKYNKWLKSGAVPSEKTYTVLIPTNGKAPNLKNIDYKVEPQQVAEVKGDIVEREEEPIKKVFPSLLSKGSKTPGVILVRINGIQSILAKNGDNLSSLAKKSNLTIEQLAKYNDLSVTDHVIEGNIYYLRKKRKRAATYYYTVQRNESLWEVSQKFGVKLSSLAKLNRMKVKDKLETGRVMWLRNRRPETLPIEVRELPTMPVDETIPLKEILKNGVKEPSMSIDTIASKDPNDQVIVVKKEESDMLLEITNHVVVKGESFYSIAQDFDVSIEDLRVWNEMNDYMLDIGQVLVIHGHKREKESMTVEVEIDFHIVEPGDTMYGISTKYSIPVNDLLRINQKDSFELSIGERLKVKE